VPVNVAQLHWEVTAQEQEGEAADRLKVRQSVAAVHPVRITQATLAQLDDAFSVPVEQPKDAVPGRGGLRVDLRARLGDGLEGVREYMSFYSYSCIEQKISQAVALRDAEGWRLAMNLLPGYLDRDGLVKYFPSEWLEGSDILTAYLLAIAHEAGWEIPETSRQRMLAGLEAIIAGRITRAARWALNDLTIRKLAAIEALSRYGLAKPEMLTSFQPEPNLWPTSALLDWISILKRVGNMPEREQRLGTGLQILRSRLNFQGTVMTFATERDDALWWLMISGDVNAVRALLTVLDESLWREDVPRVVRGALSRQLRGHWNTTTANAWGVLAMEQFSAAFESTPVTGQTAAAQAGTRKHFSWTQPQGTLEFGWPKEPGTLTLAHKGAGKPWAIVQARAALPLKEPLFTGYTIQKTITAVEQKNAGKWTRGDVARVKLDIDAQSDMAWVVVEDPVPAGASILGTGLGRDSALLSQDEQREGW
ncbi:MAG: hypothetical protein L0099_13580, partial [Acidobacteria bacterium]|nr:hypothetical protein [Acidobacteriota bacterium]